MKVGLRGGAVSVQRTKKGPAAWQAPGPEAEDSHEKARPRGAAGPDVRNRGQTRLEAGMNTKTQAVALVVASTLLSSFGSSMCLVPVIEAVVAK